MPRVRPNGAKKWVQNAGQASGAYEDGVKNPRKDWAKSTADAAENYKEGITKSLQKNSFKKGVEKAGNASWLKGAIEKGVSRYGPGVAQAESKYASNIQPFLDTIESTSLPPRYPRGDPRNIERVKFMAKALHDKKIQLQG